MQWQPGHSFAWASRSPGVTSRAAHRVMPTDAGCRVELVLEQTGPLSRLAGLLYGRLTRDCLRRELLCLTERLVSPPEPGRSGA